MPADQVLASIDSVLDDWERGPDASRWQADGGPDRLGAAFALCELDEVAHVSDELWLAMASVIVRIDVSPFVEALKQIGAALGQLSAPFLQFAHSGDAARNPREHIRCHKCNPHGNPKPLAISGTAYRHRQRARKRRR